MTLAVRGVGAAADRPFFRRDGCIGRGLGVCTPRSAYCAHPFYERAVQRLVCEVLVKDYHHGKLNQLYIRNKTVDEF